MMNNKKAEGTHKYAAFIFLYVLIFLFFLLGFILMNSQKEKFSDCDLKEGTYVSVTGRYIKKEKKTYSTYYYFDTEEYGSIIVSDAGGCLEKIGLKTGNIVSVQGTADEFSTARNYGNFDEKKYYHSLGVSMRIRLNKNCAYIIDSGFSLLGEIAAHIREKITDSLESVSSESQLGFFTAICTGDRSNMDSELKTLFQENGIAHILAVSGLHISLLGTAVLNFLRKRLHFIPAAFVSFSVILLYCVMCGFSASSLRAAIMFTFKLLSISFKRTYDMLNALSFAAILLLLSNPYYLFNSGFEYSFTAVSAYFIADKSIIRFLHLKYTVCSIFIRNIILTITLVPISMVTYYYISAYSILLNMIIIPLMSVILASAASGALAGILNVALGKFLIGIGSFSLSFTEALCMLSDSLPFSVITTGTPHPAKILIYCVIFILFCLSARFVYLRDLKAYRKDIHLNRGKTKNRLRIFCFSAAVVILICVCLSKNGTDELKIAMLDVDQGECILIMSPSEQTYLIDAGSTGIGNVGEYRIKSALRYMGVSQIDCAILTHPDSDHTNGLIELIEDTSAGRIKVRRILTPDVTENSNYEDLINTAENCGVDVINITSGTMINDQYIEMLCLHPDIGFEAEDSNDYSAVFLLRYNKFSALFTGDISSETEKMLLSSKLFEEQINKSSLTLLKVAHHGSKYSSSSEFLNYLNPSFAIISAGINNSYGHPAKETLNRISETGADIYVTSENGEIIINADASGSVNIISKF